MSRIAFLTDNLLTIGGVQRVLAVIAKELSKTHEVDIITLEENPSPNHTLYGLDESRVHIIPFRPRQSKSLCHKAFSLLYKRLRLGSKWASDLYARSSFPSPMRRAFVEQINKGRYDVVIAVHGGLSVKLATIRKALHASKAYGWMHNSYEAFFTQTPCYYPHLETHFKHQLRKLDGFVVLCQADALRYEQHMGLTPIVIHNPLTLSTASPSDGKQKRFLSIGRMTPLHKGFDLLIEAFARFAKDDEEWTLQIVGEGPEHDKLQQQIERHGLQQRITLSPFTPDIQTIYQQASIYVMASRWEGMPLVLIEALSHSLPVIAPTLPVAKEILSSDVALLFPTGNIQGLCDCMKRHAELLAKRHATIPHAQAFAVERIMGKWLQLL